MNSRVAIVGPGLLGGSIALALRARRAAPVAIWARRPEAVEELKAIAIADFSSTSLDRVVRDADLIVLCTPIGAMPALAREIAPAAKPGTLVTDVGSVKAPVVAALGAIFGGRFVGSHPMAGSEQSGLHAARADLFEGATCIVTPDAQSDAGAIAEIAEFWRSLGGIVHRMSPAAHDEAVALVSHFPHLLAAALVNMVAARDASALYLSGPGFLDSTRVAAGSPEMWAEILASNPEAVGKSIHAMIESLREIENMLARDPADPALLHLLTAAKKTRDRLRQPTSHD